MKKQIYQLIFIVILVFTFSSCMQEPDEIITNPETEKTMDNLIVNEDFSWETSQNITLVLNAISENPELNTKVSVYNGNPEKNGLLLINCGVTEDIVFEGEIQTPAYITTLYLQSEFPSGKSVLDSVEVFGNTIEYTFNESNSSLKCVSIAKSEAPESPDCSEGCDETITAISGDLTIEDGKTFCLTSDFTGGITFKGDGGTLRICGKLTLTKVNVNGNADATIEVTSTGILQTNNLNLNKDNQILKNWGTIAYSGTFSPSCTFENYGIANITGINVNSGGKIINTGDLNISGNLNNSSEVENSGSIEVSGNLQNNSNSTFTNECQLIVTGHFNQNATLENSGYIYSGGTFSANGGSSTEMISGAMIKTVNLTVNENISGSGNYSSLAVSGATKINGGGSLTGSLDICDEDGIETNNGTIAASVTYCENYIPVSECNPVGIGEPAISDADSDGVSDSQDEYPNDPTAAYNSYFPNQNATATLLFEDLWPSKGDYDFNDLVVGLQGNYVTNANNKIVKLKFALKIKAVGAALKNGLGIQFDNIAAKEVSSVTGTVATAGSNIQLNSNGTEAGQSKAVIIAIENVEDILTRAGGSMFNTVSNGLVGKAEDVEIVISFENNPVSFEKLISSSFNFFLIKNQDRGIEVHLADKAPTNLMRFSFGESDDTSDPGSGRYFKTRNNLPWGLLILEPFEYPIEKTPINTAYSEFIDWAESAGTINPDWYKDPNSSSIW